MSMPLPNPTNSQGSRFAPERPLIVGYVLKMFPRFSETFILNEVLALQKRGVRVHTFSMKEPNEEIRQPDIALFDGEQHVIPSLSGRLFP